jgi:hypothetical protein
MPVVSKFMAASAAGLCCMSVAHKRGKRIDVSCIIVMLCRDRKRALLICSCTPIYASINQFRPTATTSCVGYASQPLVDLFAPYGILNMV